MRGTPFASHSRAVAKSPVQTATFSSSDEFALGERNNKTKVELELERNIKQEQS